MTCELVSSLKKLDLELITKALGLKTKVPDDWMVCRQGDICEFINGYAYSLSEFRKTGYLIIRIQNLTGGDNYVYSDLDLPEKQFANSGDLLFAWSATFGPFIWNGPKASYHYHIWKLDLNDEVNKRFVYYHLQRISERIKIRGQSGLGMIHMTKSGMERFPFLKPPLNEQQKIASILSMVDQLIQKADQIIEHTQILKKGLMQRLLTKGIGHTDFMHMRFGSNYILFPKEWSISTLKNCTSKIGSGVTPRGGSKVYLKEGIPLIRSQNVQFYGLRLEDIVYISQEIHNEMKNSRVQEGDVLLNITGASLGRCTFVPTGFGEGNVNQHVCIIRHNDRLNQIYLSLFLSSRLGQEMIFRVNHGLSREALNYQQIGAFQIPVPPIKEQKNIAVIISKINAKIQMTERFKNGVKDIKKGLMQNLLTGRIRVKV